MRFLSVTYGRRGIYGSFGGGRGHEGYVNGQFKHLQRRRLFLGRLESAERSAEP